MFDLRQTVCGMTIDLSAIRTLLQQRFNTSIDIVEAQRLQPWFVVRCRLDSSSDDVPDSVIVKVLRQDPGGFRTDLRQVYTEQVALEFVDQLRPGFAPRLWASDLPAGVLILEDLSHLEPLAALMQQGHRLAASGLRRFASALGELAAFTMGYQAAFVARHRAVGRYDPTSVQQAVRPEVWDRTRACMSALGVPSSSALDTELAGVIDELTYPGPFLALTNGDAGPNNYLIGDTDARLIDFEAAGFRHAVEDAVCLYVPGPHWLTAGDVISEGLETAYRTALADTVPQIMDDALFGRALGCACMAWAIIRLHRFPKLDAREPGDISRRQLITTLDAATEVAATRASLPHLCTWTSRVCAALRRHWPDADVDLQTLAPYMPRDPGQPMHALPESLQVGQIVGLT